MHTGWPAGWLLVLAAGPGCVSLLNSPSSQPLQIENVQQGGGGGGRGGRQLGCRHPGAGHGEGLGSAAPTKAGTGASWGLHGRKQQQSGHAAWLRTAMMKPSMCSTRPQRAFERPAGESRLPWRVSPDDLQSTGPDEGSGRGREGRRGRCQVRCVRHIDGGGHRVRTGCRVASLLWQRW